MAKKSELTLTIRARNALKKGLRKAKRSLRKFGKSIKKVIGGASKIFKGLAHGVMAVGGALAVAIREGYKFKQGMAEVSTMLGKNQHLLKGMTDQIRIMAAEFGQSKDALTKGLYDILSAGIDASGAMEVLRAATKSAVGGITDTATAVDAITTILNAYDMEASEAGHISDVLFQIVRDGKITFAQLAENIGKLAPTAKAAGLSLENMGAIVASMVKVEKPERAMTAIRAALMKLAEKGEDIISFTRRFRGASIGTIMDEGITRRAAVGIAILTGNVDGLNDELKRFADVAGAADKAFGKMNKVRQWEKMWQAVRSTLSMVGETIQDKLAPALDRLNKKFVIWAKKGGLQKIGMSIKTAISQAEGLISLLDEAGRKRDITLAKIGDVLKKAFDYGVTSMQIAGHKFADAVVSTIRESMSWWTSKLALKSDKKTDPLDILVPVELPDFLPTTADLVEFVQRFVSSLYPTAVEKLEKKRKEQGKELADLFADLRTDTQVEYNTNRQKGKGVVPYSGQTSRELWEASWEKRAQMDKKISDAITWAKTGIKPTKYLPQGKDEENLATVWGKYEIGKIEKAKEEQRLARVEWLEEQKGLTRRQINALRWQKKLIKRRQKAIRDELRAIEKRAEAINAEKYADMRIKKAIAARTSARKEARAEEMDIKDVIERVREIQKRTERNRKFNPDYMPDKENMQFLKSARLVLEAQALEARKKALRPKLKPPEFYLERIHSFLINEKGTLAKLLKMG